MHVALEGNFQRHLLYLADKYGSAFRRKLNSRAAVYTRSYKTLTPVKKVIELVSSKIKGRHLKVGFTTHLHHD